MRFFIGAFVLNFMVFFNEIEASGLRRISTKNENEDNRTDYPGTSRFRPPSYPTYDSTSIAQQALNLSGYNPSSPKSSYQQNDGYPPHLQQSYHQESLTEIPDLVEKYGFKYGYPPQGADVTKIIEEDHLLCKKQESSPEHTGLKNTNWLINHFRTGPFPVPETGFLPSHEHRFVEDLNRKPTTNRKRRGISILNIPVKKLRAQLGEARRIYGHHDYELDDSEKDIQEQDLKNMHDMHDPHGSHNPELQLQFSQQSQLPRHDYQYYNPELTPHYMGDSNSYPANQGYDPNGPYNPYYHKGHPGASGSGSQH